MQITGKITHVGPVTSGTSSNGNTWNKFQAVITETEGEYPKSLAFEVFNDKVAVSVGEQCTIHFETKAKEWNGKWFTNINAWRKEGGQAAPAPAPVQTQAPVAAPPVAASTDDDPLF